MKTNFKRRLICQRFMFLAEGFEEVEALTVVDLLRRAEIDITIVSIMDTKRVAGAHGITYRSGRII